MIESRTSHLVIFAKQFSSMLASSLPLVTVLENLGRETPNRKLRKAVTDVAHQVTTGVDFGDALARHPGQFNGVFVGLVRSGMEAGTLPNALSHVVEYLDRLDSVNRRTKAALVYPLFLLVTFFGVAGAMIYFILPKYEAIFLGFNRDLPAPTRFLLDVGAQLREQSTSLTAAAACALALALAISLSRDARAVVDRLKLRAPVFGPIWRLAALARFSRTLAVQVGNHIALVRALRMAAGAAGNFHIERVVHAIADAIERGESVAGAFKQYETFSGIFQQMIAAGEEAGRLDELLMSAAAYFDSLLIQRIDTMTSLLNPMLTAVMGLSIAGMMVAAFLPVFDLPGAMQ